MSVLDKTKRYTPVINKNLIHADNGGWVRIDDPILLAMERLCEASIKLKIAQDEHIFAADQFGDEHPFIDPYEKAETDSGVKWLQAIAALRALTEDKP